MELLRELFVTIKSLFTTSWELTAYAIFCTLIVCVLFQVFILRKIEKKNEIKNSAWHFVCVYIFLIYIAFVYILTGLGTIWDIIFYGGLSQTAEIYWIPFGTFEMEFAASNIRSYLLNIIMMVPFGFMIALIWPSFRTFKKTVLTGFVFSLAIEISQLFNLRATTTDDLIMNTIGVIIGYLIFKVFYKLVTKYRDKSNEQEVVTKYPSKLLKNEAVIYLICSFVGVFLFYNGLIQADWSDRNVGAKTQVSEKEVAVTGVADDKTGEEKAFETENVDEETNDKPSDEKSNIIEFEYTTGYVEEINDDSVSIDVHVVESTPDGDMMYGAGRELKAIIDQNTIFETTKTDGSGTTDPIIAEATKEDIKNGDMVDIYLKDGSDNIAEKIVIWRFS